LANASAASWSINSPTGSVAVGEGVDVLGGVLGAVVGGGVLAGVVVGVGSGVVSVGVGLGSGVVSVGVGLGSGVVSVGVGVGSGVVSVGFGVDVVGGRPGLAEAPTGAAIPPITSAASAATATARRLDNVAPQCIGPDEPGPYHA